jgi:hypothetical protein
MSFFNSLPEVLKQLGSFTAVFYAFGFLAVRARLNALGVWSHVPIVDVSYLTEGALFFLTTAFAFILPYGLTIVFLSVLFWGVYRLLSLRKPELIERSKEYLGRALVPLQVSALLVTFCLIVTYATPALGIVDLLIENGQRTVPKIMWASLTDVHSLTNVYGAIVSIAVASFLLFVWVKRSNRVPKFYMVAAGLAMVLMVLLLPLNYAVLLRVQDFPEAEISLKNERKSRTVVLLQQAGDQLAVRGKDKTITIIPRADVSRIRIKKNISLGALIEEASNEKNQ